MIGLLTGTIILRNDPHLIIDVHGVGYKVYGSYSLLKHTIGDALQVFIHTYVREDALDLYGFISGQELRVFEYLIGISGIGPKTAMGVFALGTTSDILQAIRKADVDFFTGVPRLGRKNAQKIIIELKNKLGSETDLDLSADGENSEIVSALTSMGFSEKEARSAVRSVGNKGKDMNDTLRLSLKYLGK